MNSDSNKLLPTYRHSTKLPSKGKRTVISIAYSPNPKISSNSKRESHLPKNYRKTCALTQTPFYISALLENANTKSG